MSNLSLSTKIWYPGSCQAVEFCWQFLKRWPVSCLSKGILLHKRLIDSWTRFGLGQNVIRFCRVRRRRWVKGTKNERLFIQAAILPSSSVFFFFSVKLKTFQGRCDNHQPAKICLPFSKNHRNFLCSSQFKMLPSLWLPSNYSSLALRGLKKKDDDCLARLHLAIKEQERKECLKLTLEEDPSWLRQTKICIQPSRNLRLSQKYVGLVGLD